jgi:hypothetical protein
MDDQSYATTGEAEIAPAGWPKPVGVLSLVFGILAVTCGVIGVGMMFASDAIMGSMMGGALPPNTPPPPFSPPMGPLMLASAGFGLVVNVILIFAGIKLLKREQSGRSLHLLYALLAIVASFISSFAGYQAQQAQQAEMTRWIEQYGEASDFGRQMKQQQQAQAPMQGPMQAVGLVVGLVIGLAWPVFCVIWFGMSKKAVPPALEY